MYEGPVENNTRICHFLHPHSPIIGPEWVVIGVLPLASRHEGPLLKGAKKNVSFFIKTFSTHTQNVIILNVFVVVIIVNSIATMKSIKC